MSIKLIARDLYRSRKEVERLEQRLETAPMEQRVAIEEALRTARAQMQHIQRALDGQIGR